MNINEIDFYELCLNEGGVFYTKIYGLEKDEFNQWMVENLKEIGSVESFENVTPSSIIMEKVYALGYEHINYQCHYSAKALTILDKEIRYFTGFVERYSFHYPIITHSFNLVNGKIIDCARIENPEDPFNKEDKNLPHTYYGIEIPREFIMKFQEETLTDKSMKPLLFEWFEENN